VVARVSGLRAYVAGHEDRPARRVRSMAPFVLLKVHPWRQTPRPELSTTNAQGVIQPPTFADEHRCDD